VTTTSSDASAGPSTPTPPDAAQEHHGSAFGWTFWMLNVIEAFERLAYFGIRAVVPIYIASATEPGGLHLTQIHRGVIYAWWAIFQSWLPMFTGGFADRLGYKRTLGFAISMNVIGYVMMAFLHNYVGFFSGIIVLATGTAFFKPALQGSIAQKLTKDNASMGWGVFYWVVNVGAFGAPFLATLILGKPHSAEGWRNLFLASAGYTACNLLVLFTFRDVPSGADKTKSMAKTFAETVENIWIFWFVGGKLHAGRFTAGLIAIAIGVALCFVPNAAALAGVESSALADYQGLGAAVLILGGVLLMTILEGGRFQWQLRLPAFILIMSCFWLMMYQLWDLHPNFIEDWIDSSWLAAHVPFDAWWEYGDRGLIRVPQQILLNLNAGLIILCIIPLSWLVRRMRTLSAMLIGMTVATCGILVAGFSTTGVILLCGVALFSFGEMLTGPKKNQYLGLIAPPGKKGLYLGYVNIPIGLGVGLGSLLAGYVYDGYGEKASLALKELGANPQLTARAVRACDWSDSLELIPDLGGIDRDQALSEAASTMGVAEREAARYLLTAFRFDQGQVVNLALVHRAMSQDTDQDFTKRLHDALTSDDIADRPSVSALRAQLGKGLAPTQTDLAAIVDLLPRALDRGRTEIVAIVEDEMNQDRKTDDKLSYGQVVDALWKAHGENPNVLNNLALEYLAQNTDLVADQAAKFTFEDPTEEMEDAIGIGRTKAFAALSAANGADEAAVDEALAELGMDDPDLAAWVYVAELPQYRFNAVARRDWSQNLPLLRALIAASPDADPIVADFYKKKRLDPDEPKSFEALADAQTLLQKIVDGVQWRTAPLLAGEFLQLNPYEARAIISANLNEAPLKTTKLLWDKYDPQYHVWIPFAAIGVVAIIALAIFGQMAKRWADMNA
jgi:MFS family permease